MNTHTHTHTHTHTRIYTRQRSLTHTHTHATLTEHQHLATLSRASDRACRCVGTCAKSGHLARHGHQYPQRVAHAPYLCAA